MSSSSLANLGQAHLIAGSISASGTAALTTNDGSAALTDNGTGDFTVTFGQSFLSVPAVVATIIDPTDSTTQAHSVAILSVSTAAVRFNVKTVTTNGTATDILSALADVNFNFMAFGTRNN